MDWDLLHSHKPGEQYLLDAVKQGFWSQHVNFPTHRQGNLLDLVLSSHPELVSEVNDMGPIGSSDHTSLMINIKGFHKPTKSKEMVPDWIWGGENNFSVKDFHTIEFSSLSLGEDPANVSMPVKELVFTEEKTVKNYLISITIQSQNYLYFQSEEH